MPVSTRLCGQTVQVEPVVVTTYRIVCPVHGVVGQWLSLKEASTFGGCKMPHDRPIGPVADEPSC